MAVKIDRKEKNVLGGKKAAISKRVKAIDAPDFNSLFDPGGMDGLPDNPGETPEDVAGAETAAMMQMIRENRKNNAERFRDIEAGEFWFCVCFQSRSQKEAFLQDAGWQEMGDKYLDGLEVARRIGVKVEPIQLAAKRAKLAPKFLRETEVI